MTEPLRSSPAGGTGRHPLYGLPSCIPLPPRPYRSAILRGFSDERPFRNPLQLFQPNTFPKKVRRHYPNCKRINHNTCRQNRILTIPATPTPSQNRYCHARPFVKTSLPGAALFFLLQKYMVIFFPAPFSVPTGLQILVSTPT